MAGQPLNTATRARIGYSLGPSAFEFPIAVRNAADRDVTFDWNSGDCADAVVELNPSDLLSITFTTEPLGIVSSQFIPETLNTVGCVFAEGRDRLTGRETAPDPANSCDRRIAAFETTSADESEVATAPTAAEPSNVRSHTRFRPPCDVIRLEDRLRLLLEPPLEALLAAGSLSFAFPPFPYQLDGVAFLYARHQALLADEMGLGKTMQAITAMRLLIHQRQLRRVLLVCPKSLVTN